MLNITLQYYFHPHYFHTTHGIAPSKYKGFEYHSYPADWPFKLLHLIKSIIFWRTYVEMTNTFDKMKAYSFVFAKAKRNM